MHSIWLLIILKITSTFKTVLTVESRKTYLHIIFTDKFTTSLLHYKVHEIYIFPLGFRCCCSLCSKEACEMRDGAEMSRVQAPLVLFEKLLLQWCGTSHCKTMFNYSKEPKSLMTFNIHSFMQIIQTDAEDRYPCLLIR